MAYSRGPRMHYELTHEHGDESLKLTHGHATNECDTWFGSARQVSDLDPGTKINQTMRVQLQKKAKKMKCDISFMLYLHKSYVHKA